MMLIAEAAKEALVPYFDCMSVLSKDHVIQV